MAITRTLLPSNAPSHALPYDTLNAFALAQTLTATGYASNVNTQLTYGPGRFEGYWALDITTLELTTGDYYQFYLLGSNDPAWGNGNVDLLAARDFGITSAVRLVPTIMGASPFAISGGVGSPPAWTYNVGVNQTYSTTNASGAGGIMHAIPFSNEIGEVTYEYLQLYVVIGGTTPSITFSSWLVPWSGQKM